MRSSFILSLAGVAFACTAASPSAEPDGTGGAEEVAHTGGKSGSAAGASGRDANGATASGGASSNGARGGTTSGAGASNGGTDARDAPAEPVFSCNTRTEPAELPLPRLSRVQLEGTLKAAIRLALPDEADAIWSAANARFSQYPTDQRRAAPGDLKGGYSRFDQSIQLSQVQAMYAVGSEIASQLTATPARLTKLLGACATDTSTANDRACLETFLRRWAARVMRSELTADDVTFYAGIAEGTPVKAAAVADVIATVLNAPETLYRVEHGTSDAEASALSAFELAARLSYNLWQEPPDDQLWSAAADGSLLEPAKYAAEVDRLIADEKLRRSLDEWISEWLRLGELPPLDTLNGDARFVAFAGAELPTASTRQAMIDDVLDSAWGVLHAGQSASALLSDRHAYAKEPVLARIYGVSSWDGRSSPPLMSSPNRSGLLTRAALLATGTAGTRPIHKGYLVRNALLCQQLGAPPQNANTETPVATSQQTTREAVSARTSPASCAGCHSIINPAGFVTERFDALGRERNEEKLFDEQGRLVASLPLDTSATLAVKLGESRPMSSAPELTQAMDSSLLFQSCLARHYFRFAQARVEDAERDGCVLSKLERAARSDAPLSEVLKSLVTDESFKTKRFE